MRRRINVEFSARQLPALFFQAPDFLFHRARHFVERIGIDADPGAFDLGQHWCERQVNFLVDAFELLLLNLRAESRSKSLQVIGALSGPASQHDVKLPHDHVGKVVIRGGGPQQVRIKLRRVQDTRGSSCKQLKKFWIVDDLRPLGIGKERLKGLQRFALIVEPDGAPFPGFG